MSASMVSSKRSLDVEQPRNPINAITNSEPVSSREPSPDSILRQAKKSKSLLDESAVGRPVARRDYAPGASIVLIGIRGTGKSSLAIIASAALNFRLIDADQYFHEHTKFSRAAFRSKHGNSEYRKCETQMMRSMLSDHQSRCVIACGPGSVEGMGRAMLMEYAKSHPVIYIMRDTIDIQRYLNAWSIETLSNLVELTGPTYRTSSNFEFYNLSEKALQETAETDLNGTNGPPSLTLKNAEQGFLRLLNKCINPAIGIADRTARHSLASVDIELRPFTYALQLPLSYLPAIGDKINDLDTTADIIEFVVDLPLGRDGQQMLDNAMANEISRHYYTIRQRTLLPVLFHVPLETTTSISSKDQSHDPDGEKRYFALLHHALRLAPRYLSVNLGCSTERIRTLLAAKGSTKVMGHYFDHHPGTDGWSSQHRKDKLRLAIELGCDLVRLCQDTKSPIDNLSVRQFVHNYNVSENIKCPLIAYNQGLAGRLSCWQNRVFSPVTHSVLRSMNPTLSSTGILTIREAQNALYASFTLDRLNFGVYGGSVAASLSPAIHNAAFAYCGMPHDYKIFETASLKNIDELCADPHFGGASISAPFKTEIMAKIDVLSPDARAIGAVNTLIPLRSKDSDALLERNRAGPIVALYGENTDWIGVHASVRRNLSPINAVTAQTSGLVLGAGGMARAAVYALIRLGVHNIFVYNRTLEKATALACHFDKAHEARNSSQSESMDVALKDSNKSGPKVMVLKSINESWPVSYQHPTIIVSCVPAHETGTKTPTNISLPLDWLESSTGGVFVELVYQPLDTLLLQQVRELSNKGWIAVDGLQVLPEQGISQFEVFTGRKAPPQLMRDTLLRYYNERKYSLDGISTLSGE